MESSYWSKAVGRRISRRRALGVVGGGAFSAAFLAACGGDDDEPSTTGATGTTSGLITAPTNTLAQAKAGGVIRDFYTAELTHMDALLSNSASTVNLISVFAYPRLMKFTV